MVGLGRLELPTSPLSEKSAIAPQGYSKEIFNRMEYLFTPSSRQIIFLNFLDGRTPIRGKLFFNSIKE